MNYEAGTLRTYRFAIYKNFSAYRPSASNRDGVCLGVNNHVELCILILKTLLRVLHLTRKSIIANCAQTALGVDKHSTHLSVRIFRPTRNVPRKSQITVIPFAIIRQFFHRLQNTRLPQSYDFSQYDLVKRKKRSQAAATLRLDTL